MTKQNESCLYEIINHINSDIKLENIYYKEVQKSRVLNPNDNFYDRMEECYKKAKQKLKYENI